MNIRCLCFGTLSRELNLYWRSENNAVAVQSLIKHKTTDNAACSDLFLGCLMTTLQMWRYNYRCRWVAGTVSSVKSGNLWKNSEPTLETDIFRKEMNNDIGASNLFGYYLNREKPTESDHSPRWVWSADVSKNPAVLIFVDGYLTTLKISKLQVCSIGQKEWWMIHQEGIERQWAWTNLDVFMEFTCWDWRKSWKTSVKIPGVPAGNWT
jgi:hypothetical protein